VAARAIRSCRPHIVRADADLPLRLDSPGNAPRLTDCEGQRATGALAGTRLRVHVADDGMPATPRKATGSAVGPFASRSGEAGWPTCHGAGQGCSQHTSRCGDGAGTSAAAR
jgi:hypothetical protein